MFRDEVCRHVSPVVVNAVEGGGWRAHCLRCGMLGSVEANSVSALDSIQRSEPKVLARGAGETRYLYAEGRNPARLEELGKD